MRGVECVHNMTKHVSRIDTRALDGLRGVAALHVMTGHYWGVGNNIINKLNIIS